MKCFSTTIVWLVMAFSFSAQGQDVLAELSIATSHKALYHYGKAPDKRWNFVFMTKSDLVVKVTAEDFQPIRDITVEKIHKFDIEEILTVHFTLRYVNIWFLTNKGGDLSLLKVHKISGNSEVIQLRDKLNNQNQYLESISTDKGCYTFMKPARSNELILWHYHEEDGFSQQVLDVDQTFAKLWAKAKSRFPQQHTYVQSNHSSHLTTHKETAAPAKLFADDDHITLSIDEPYKTHVLQFHRITKAVQSKTYHFSFPPNVSISDNFTNSFILHNTLYQALAGNWGIALQRHHLYVDSSSTQQVWRVGHPESAALLNVYSLHMLSDSVKRIDFNRSWIGPNGYHTLFGIACKEVDAQIQVQLGFVNWMDKNLAEATASTNREAPKERIDGITYILNTSAQHIGQTSYQLAKYTAGNFAMLTLDSQEFTPLKCLEPNPFSHTNLFLIEKHLTTKLIQPQMPSYIPGDTHWWYVFYHRRESLLMIVAR